MTEAVQGQALAALARAMGVVPVYRDQMGGDRVTPPATTRTLLAAMGLDAGTEAACEAALDDIARRDDGRALPAWLVVEQDTPAAVPGLDGIDWDLSAETGETSSGRGPGIGALPLGIHRLEARGAVCWLLSAPPSLPEPPRAWGLTLPLYGLATDRGVGTYGDLARAVAAAGSAGAAFAGANPIHAGFPGDPQAFSPYAPSSRRRFSTLHIDAGADPGPPGDLVDYAAVLPAQTAALETSFAAAGLGADFADWRASQGEALELFALHQALAEAHGPYWRDWPETLHDPMGADVRAFAADHAERVTFHAWAQFTAEAQLGKVREAGNGMALGLYLDLAVGTHPSGAETWAQPHLFAAGVSLGAPPDEFSAEGQKWGLAPLIPAALAAEGFRPLAEILRAQLRHARLLRIDHILGFERTFWVPEAGGPGAYVQMPRHALLAVARIEAARVGATIVGEDLGNIPDGLGAALDASGLLGCRVAIFEMTDDATGGDDPKAAPGTVTVKPPDDYDRRVLTSFSTHDLPTFEGWRRGLDIDWRHRLGSIDDDAARRIHARRATEAAAFTAAAGGTSVDDMHRHLARTASLLVAVQAEDFLGLAEQANLPGTVHEHPNWRRRLPVAPDDLANALADTARIMRAEGR